MTLTTIVAHMVCLASSLYVCVHAWRGWHITAAEAGLRHLVINGIVVPWYTGDFVQVLFVFMLVMMWSFDVLNGLIGRLNGIGRFSVIGWFSRMIQ